MFTSFGVMTYMEVEQLKEDIQHSNSLLAAEELAAAINSAHQDAINATNDFAQWNEVLQQINNPYYYAYWRNLRGIKPGQTPDYVLDVAVYDKSGKVLSKIDTSSLPQIVDVNNLNSYVDIHNGLVELVVFAHVINETPESIYAGYVATRSRLMPDMIHRNQFTYIDGESIRVGIEQVLSLPVSELSNYVTYSLYSHSVMDKMIAIVVEVLLKMALIIGLPTILLYPLVNYLISKPLQQISNHIDHLKDESDTLRLPEYGRSVPIAELEKVRSSLNEYHQQLFEVHSSLDDKNKELWTLAHHDSLTGVLNRRAFDEYWSNLNALFMDSRFDICLVIFDVNNFKAFNDTYGHSIGDEVLKGISSSLMQVLRKGENLYRLGGDEFAAVFIDCTADKAVRIVDRCVKSVAEFPFAEFEINEPVRVSAGIAHSQILEDSLMTLLWQADIAMYAAKQPGHSHVAVYDESMKSDAKGVFSSWVNHVVYEAIDSGLGIQMHYQPIVRIEDRCVEYYEALVRIEHDHQLIMPDEIFKLVEARRIETEMDLAILRAIYTDLEQGKIPQGTGVAVNVSGPAILDTRIMKLLMKFSRFSNDYKLVIEITETALITQIDKATENLKRLQSEGFYIALDDFGSGYSSVRYLASMPVDIVKFDIMLIRSLGDESQHTIVKHLADMISETGHRLVAEGIETEDMLTKVNALGFSFGQGYLFGKPAVKPEV